jgi:hypothetical protein
MRHLERLWHSAWLSSSQRKYPRDILLSFLTVKWIEIYFRVDTCQSSQLLPVRIEPRI